MKKFEFTDEEIELLLIAVRDNVKKRLSKIEKGVVDVNNVGAVRVLSVIVSKLTS
jgi:hypothetical protein